MPGAWIEIALAVHPTLKDGIINRLFELGAEGVSDTDEAPLASVRGYFEEERRETVIRELTSYLQSLAELFPKLPKVEIKTTSVRNEGWADRYKEFYVAQRLTKTFFLKPAWDTETEVPAEMIPIVMEPGQAFGTGLHNSTILCLKLIEHVLDFYPVPSAVRLLDVGTGSGILAIGAMKLGVRHVDAFDVDPVAVETANENFKRNLCDIEARVCELRDYKTPYDVIVSNILLETHKTLAAEYRRLLKPKGQLILSGLLGTQLAEIDEGLQAVGFVRDLSDSSQEWLAVVYRRNDPS